MGYRLAGNTGDTLAVPQLVLTHLRQTDGDTIRAALYILQTRDTDPRTMARALALPSIETAKRALQGGCRAAGERARRSPRPGRACPCGLGQRDQRPLCGGAVSGGAERLRQDAEPERAAAAC